MNKYLWIAPGLSDEQVAEILYYGGSISSSYVSQINILTGLESVLKNELDTINGYSFDEYPKHPRLIIKQSVWSRNNSSINVSPEYINVKYFNRVFKTIALIKIGEKYLKGLEKGANLKIIVYSMHSPFLILAWWITVKHRKSQIFLVVPDLPSFMDMNMNLIKRFLKNVDWILIKLILLRIKKYILYSKNMANYLNIRNEQWLLMEGSVNTKEILKTNRIEKESGLFIIMYSGVLDKKYGIDLLVKAFCMCDNDNFRLWLTGSGDYLQEINDVLEKDTRVKLWGFIPSRIDLLKLQNCASVLVNVRLPSELSSKYCFPSKLLEFMLSGNPVLSFKIDGIPEEYFEYIVEMTPSIDGVRHAIMNMYSLSESERIQIGDRARKFIIDNKTNIKQAEKIKRFIGD